MRKKILEIIKKHCALEEAVTEKSKLEDLSLDSLSFVAIIADIETELGIEFEIEELDINVWETAEDVLTATEEKINEKTYEK